MKPRVALIGPGRLGQAVGRLLQEAGYDFRAVIGRDPQRTSQAARFIGCRQCDSCDLRRAADAELILIAVPDDHIGEVAAALRHGDALRAGTTLVHFSGIHPAAILLGAEGPKLQALSLHPLQTFADAVMGVKALPGSPVAIEGLEDVLPLAETLATDMGGGPFRIEAGQKPLYHAAASVASNSLTALAATAAELMAACGFSAQEGLGLLLPLMRATLANISTLGPELALTGPIARGDVHTVAKHLKALAGLPGDVGDLYRVMGKRTVELAPRKGTLEEEPAQRLRRMLQEEGKD